MEISGLLWFAIWAAAIFLMMRFGCGAHVMGHGHTGKRGAEGSGGADGLRWIAPEQEVDPVCGKIVRTVDAKSSIFDGRVYYFCSRDCRELFETAPDSYLPARPARAPGQLEHRHG